MASVHVQRATSVLVVLAALTVVRIVNGITVTGSGGLGAVSFGLTEALLEFLVLAAIVSAFFYWRARRQRDTQQSVTRR